MNLESPKKYILQILFFSLWRPQFENPLFRQPATNISRILKYVVLHIPNFNILTLHQFPITVSF